MLKNSKIVLFVTLKSWSGRKLLDPTAWTCTIISLYHCRLELKLCTEATLHLHFM